MPVRPYRPPIRTPRPWVYHAGAVAGETVKKGGERFRQQAEKASVDRIAQTINVAVDAGIHLIIVLGGTSLVALTLSLHVVDRVQDSGDSFTSFALRMLGVPTSVFGMELGQSNDHGGTEATGQKVADVALRWAGRDFKRGEKYRCADFVRAVLKEAGVEVGVRRGSAGPLMADSFAGDELGQIIKNKSQLQPGDIVMFKNTYDGPGWDNITHVGIYVGGGMIIDRPTSASPVQHRPLSTFREFWGALRPSSYRTSDAGVGGLDLIALREAIKVQESGGNSRAINSRTQAAGAWQVLPSNIPSWSQQCLGSKLTTTQFLLSKDSQEEIVECKLAEYAKAQQSHANTEEQLVRRVAALWYSGDANLYNNPRRQGPRGSEPSIQEYTLSIWSKYQGLKQ